MLRDFILVENDRENLSKIKTLNRFLTNFLLTSCGFSSHILNQREKTYKMSYLIYLEAVVNWRTSLVGDGETDLEHVGQTDGRFIF